MKQYRIAGMIVAGEDLPDSFAPFEISGNFSPVCTILNGGKHLPETQTAATVEHDALVVDQLEDGTWRYRSPPQCARAEVHSSNEYRTILFSLPEVNEAGEQQLLTLLRTALECRLIREGALVVHAACVEQSGAAVAFSGKSGVGKSTRASQWVKSNGASWISGDRPVIRWTERGAAACGVPWDGKEQIFRATEYPLKAVLQVRRAEHTLVRRLTREQAFRFLIQQTFLPMWDTLTAQCAMENARRFADSAVWYRALCGPDELAAQEVRSILYDRQEEILQEESDMKIKSGFRMTQVAGEYMVLPLGSRIKTFEGAVYLNACSAFLYEQMEQGVSRGELLHLFAARYPNVDPETAAADLDELIATLREYDMLNEEEE